MPSFFGWVALIVWLGLAPPIAAAPPEGPPDPPPAESEAPGSETPDRPMVDTAHYHISNSLLSSAEWLDAFFDDERYESEANKSRFKLSFEGSVINGEGVNFDADTHLKIVLPELEDRLSFEISGDTDDEIRDVGPQNQSLKETVDGDDDRKPGGLTASFRYLLKATDRLNIHLKSGARIRSLEPVVYIGPRYRQTVDRDPWLLRLTQRFRWFSNTGWESRSRFDLDRAVSAEYFFRATTQVEWYEEENGLFYDLDFSLSHPIDGRSAIEFEWNNRFKTRPHNQLSATVLRLRYRRRVWRDWLSFEVTPQIAYPRDREYNFTPGVIFKFTIVFGFYSETGYY